MLRSLVRPPSETDRRPVTPSQRRAAVLLAAVLGILGAGVRAAQAGTVTLAWDPSPSPGVTGYRVFVGTESRRYTATYDVGPLQTSIVLSPLDDGLVHYFAVASMSGSLVGPRSEEISGTPSPQLPDESVPSFGGMSTARLSGSSVAPGRSAPVGLGPVRGLVMLPDGRSLVIEADLRGRLVTPGADANPVVLQLPESQTLAAAAVGPDFQRSRYVVTAEVRTQPQGRTLDLVRYRELANTLGERATLVAGIPLPGQGRPLLALDGGFVYVLIPELREGQSAALLRYAMDGTVPAGNPGGSPAIAAAPADVIALGASATGAVWAADTSGSIWVRAGDAGWERASSGVPVADAGPVETAALADTNSGGGTWFASTRDGRVWRLDASGSIEHPEVPGTGDRELAAAVAARRGELAIAVQTGSDQGEPSYRLLHVPSP